MGVAISEGDIIRDENERGNLQRAIADLETAIAVSNPGTRRILEFSLAGAKVRVSALDKKIEEAKVERAAELQTQAAAAAALAAKETGLSAKERETYKGFIEESYFTKKDFGKLDQFYLHSYDRLSEGGKEEMSKRIDEGIRRGEFKAADLPESVRKRQVEQKHLTAKESKEGEQISKADALEDTEAKLSNNKGSMKQPLSKPEPVGEKEIDLSSINLKGVKLIAAASEPTASSIPDVSGPGARARS